MILKLFKNLKFLKKKNVQITSYNTIIKSMIKCSGFVEDTLQNVI